MFRHLLISALGLLIVNFTVAQATKTAEQHYADGIALQEQKKYADALVAFKNAINLNGAFKEALYEAGSTSIRLKKYAQAITYLQKSKAYWPREPKVFLELGYANERLEKIKLAKDNYYKCIALKVDFAPAYEHLGFLYFTEGDFEKTVYNLETYIRYETGSIKDWDVYYRKGFAENELGKPEKAIETLNKSLALNEKEPNIYNELGYAYFKLANAEDAIKNYNKALEISATSLAAFNGIGDVYKDLKKNVPEALKNYLKAFEINPGIKKLNYSIGWCYNDIKRYSDAVSYLKKAIALDPVYVSAITELGFSEYALHLYDDALFEFTKVSMISKTEVSVYYSGLCHVGKKDKAAATKSYNELTAMKSSYADALKKKIDALTPPPSF